jgi:DNA-binding transcriptional ArsR family regulator
MKSVWSKMPSRWIVEGQLREFRPRTAGPNAAALKLYMALTMFANFKPLPGAEHAGFARLSFSELEMLCDISRRYVALGLDLLEARELISIEKVGNANRYRLANYDDKGWAKLPRGHFLEESRFKGLGIRGDLCLNALKLYLALVTFRPNNAQQVLLSYDKIEEYTGIPRPRIRRAIDVLLNHDWISLAAHAPDPSEHKSTNVYILRGDFWGRKQQTYARASLPTSALLSGS